MDHRTQPWRIQLARFAAGLILCGGLALLACWAGLRFNWAPPRQAARLYQIAPAVVVWCALLGAVTGWRGRQLIASIDRLFLDPHRVAPTTRALVHWAAALALLALVQQHLVTFALAEPVDFPSFLYAARALAAGQDFYDPAVLARLADANHDATVFPYIYLPLYAVLFLPWASLPLPTTHVFFLVFNSLLWLLLLVQTARLLDLPAHLRAPVGVLGLLLLPTFFPALLTMHHGSPSLLIAVLVSSVFLLERQRRSAQAGLLLALAIMVKIVPVLLLPYFLLRRRFRLLLWTGAAGLAWLAVSVTGAGWESHWRWLVEVAPNLATSGQTGTFFEPACHAENQSLTGMACKLLGVTSPWYRPVTTLAGLAVVMASGLVLWRRRQGHLDRLELSLMQVVLLLVSTITWFHHMTLMLLPALSLVVAGAEGPRHRPALIGVGMVILAFIGSQYYLDPWPFLRPNAITHTARFQAVVLSYLLLMALLWRSRRGDHADAVATGNQEGQTPSLASKGTTTLGQ
jgi:hypothetical protein